MSGIALLVPREEMLRQAQAVIAEGEYKVDHFRCINTKDSAKAAEEVSKSGASVIIARGLQASIIGHSCNLPMVLIRMTAQEMGLLVTQAKRIVSTLRPRIAVVGMKNMLCDMTSFNAIFGIELQIFYYDTADQYQSVTERAIAWKPDVLIGGALAVDMAAKAGIPTLFLSSSEDSIREAMRNAATVKYASDIERRTTAQMDTLMNSSFNGVIQLTAEGKIQKINNIMEEILGSKADTLIGRKLSEIIPNLEEKEIQKVLHNNNPVFTTFCCVNHQSLLGILTPIEIEAGIEGAIFSFNRVKKNAQMESLALPEKYLGSNTALLTFDHLHKSSEKMECCIEQAKLFSQSSRPILICGEMGTERTMLAQCIHSNSLFRSGAFVPISCSGQTDEQQQETLFGTGRRTEEEEQIDLGAFGVANNGTLLLYEVDTLSLPVQYRIYQAVRYKAISHRELSRPMNIDLRIIATCSESLASLVEKGLFREDLYYLLSGLTLEVPPLRERPQDLKDTIRQYFKAFCELYDRYHTLTEGAFNVMLSYPWYGNRIQIESFCERLILLAKHRSIDEGTVRALLNKMYPIIREQKHMEHIVLYSSPEAEQIQDVLTKYNGDRTKTADELGISKTTLWRRMKKYGLNDS